MPRREQYIEPVAEVLAPYLQDASIAWRGFYQLLLWFERGVPHIIDGDKLQKGIWRARAEAVQLALAKEFHCAPNELPDKTDFLIKSPIFAQPPQRHNPLGIGFVTALFLALDQFSSDDYKFLSEKAIGAVVFHGIKEAPRSRPDIVVTRDDAEIAVISAKWSLRHDRLKDVKDECNYFKTLMGSLKFYVVTNEFDPARLSKLLEDYRIDAVFHVNRRMVVDVAKVDGRLEPLRDLSELLQLFAK